MYRSKLKDVKSSNGTFINGERLGLEGHQSEPNELKSDGIFVHLPRPRRPLFSAPSPSGLLSIRCQFATIAVASASFCANMLVRPQPQLTGALSNTHPIPNFHHNAALASPAGLGNMSMGAARCLQVEVAKSRETGSDLLVLTGA
ncbi:hypothetical protein C8R45DRAFT_1081007 [Mycena sanguinolenta]|nr:hypothetical protein C8R45DRAFT_1081007 [Mycena sanguinolenta]